MNALTEHTWNQNSRCQFHNIKMWSQNLLNVNIAAMLIIHALPETTE